ATGHAGHTGATPAARAAHAAHAAHLALELLPELLELGVALLGLLAHRLEGLPLVRRQVLNGDDADLHLAVVGVLDQVEDLDGAADQVHLVLGHAQDARAAALA